MADAIRKKCCSQDTCFSSGIGKDTNFQRGSKELSAGGGVLNSLANIRLNVATIVRCQLQVWGHFFEVCQRDGSHSGLPDASICAINRQCLARTATHRADLAGAVSKAKLIQLLSALYTLKWRSRRITCMQDCERSSCNNSGDQFSTFAQFVCTPCAAMFSITRSLKVSPGALQFAASLMTVMPASQFAGPEHLFRTHRATAPYQSTAQRLAHTLLLGCVHTCVRSQHPSRGLARNALAA